jgi:peroxiredoxin
MRISPVRKLVLIGIAFPLLGAFQYVKAQGETGIPRPAPYFILPGWDGKVLKSTTLKGQVVLIDFFQTWCPDCQKSSPQLQKLYQRYKDKGFTVVGISHDKEGAKAVEPFVKKYGITYSVLIGDLSIAVSYIGITPQKPSFRIPYVFLIDRKGNIVGEYEEGTHKEAMDVEFLENRIKTLVAE